jgi:hypothetical protein
MLKATVFGFRQDTGSGDLQWLQQRATFKQP